MSNKLSKIFSAIITLISALFFLLGQASAQVQYKVLYEFSSQELTPGPLSWGPEGSLYGANEIGGAYGYGAILRMTPGTDGTWTESVLYSFLGGTEGAKPYSVLTLDASGSLYGATQLGGDLACSHYGGDDHGCGVVFKLTPNQDGTWTESVLHAFSGGAADGESPSGVIVDTAGNVYGTALWGGTPGGGVVYKISPNPDGSWAESIIHNFGADGDGGAPLSGVIMDAAGNLYGTASLGGPGSGVAFQLTPNPDGSWSEKVLHAFTNGRDGGTIDAGLVMDAKGNLYGTAYNGGDFQCSGYGCGTVFQLVPNANGTWKTNVLHTFTFGNDGAHPGGVVIDGSGNLYALAVGGRTLDGLAFRLSPNPNGGWKEYVLHNFSDRTGGNPYVGMILDAAGNLYGTTPGGQFSGPPVLYKITRE